MFNKKDCYKYFEGNKDAQVLFFDAEGVGYHEQPKAQDNAVAKKLKDTTVTKVTRAEAEEWAGAKESEEGDEVKPYSKWKKAELINELESRELEYAEGATNKELIAILEEDDETEE